MQGRLSVALLGALLTVLPLHAMSAEAGRIAEVESLKADAEAAMRRHQWPSANLKLKAAIATLGDAYVQDDVADDTGMKLVTADIQEKEGRMSNAVIVRYMVLNARLALLKSGR